MFFLLKEVDTEKGRDNERLIESPSASAMVDFEEAHYKHVVLISAPCSPYIMIIIQVRETN